MNIRDYLKSNPIVFDGAMSTYLQGKYPVYVGEECEKLNLTSPEIIEEIHEEYIKAGANAIKTNSFSLNGNKISDMSELEKMIKLSVNIAKKAIKKTEKDVWLFGDIGQIVFEENDNAFEMYKEVVNIFLKEGVENFLFETMSTPDGLEEIARYIKEKVEDSFIIVSFATSPEGYTQSGFLMKNLYNKMQNNDFVDAVGFNCLSGPKHLLEMTKKLGKMRNKYLSIMPNAGYPTMVGNRIYYGKTKKYFSKIIGEIIENGAAIVGGCCGTTPKDIANVIEEIKQKSYDPVDFNPNGMEVCRENNNSNAISISGMNNEKNDFAKKLKAGKKVLVVELDPPVEPDIDFFMEGAARYKYAGVDAIDIADCPIAKARIDSSLLASKISRELNLTAIPHLTCRDRNFNATKALLLGLNVEGVRNVLTVTGDPVPVAMRKDVKTVFSYNSAILARHIQSVNEQVFSDNPFLVSGALNINAVNFDAQINHAKRKIENGVSVLFTQPVLSTMALENLKRAKNELDVKILGGIMPVVSHRNATFMNNEMAGIFVDDEIIKMYEGKNREEGEKIAYDISIKIIDDISPYVDGYYVITPFKRVDLILKIIKYIKSKCQKAL